MNWNLQAGLVYENFEFKGVLVIPCEADGGEPGWVIRVLAGDSEHDSTQWYSLEYLKGDEYTLHDLTAEEQQRLPDSILRCLGALIEKNLQGIWTGQTDKEQNGLGRLDDLLKEPQESLNGDLKAGMIHVTPTTRTYLHRRIGGRRPSWQCVVLTDPLAGVAEICESRLSEGPFELIEPTGIERVGIERVLSAVGEEMLK